METKIKEIFLIVLLMKMLVMVECRRDLPFKIPGPKSLNDKIAIVGAGPAGIHMALALKNRGFTNVWILEKTRWFGGKSWTVQKRGAANELGTVYLAPDYSDVVVPLIKRYAPGDLRDLPEASIWLDIGPRKPIKLSDYVFDKASRYFKETDLKLLIKLMLQKIHIYVGLHRKLFGDYVGEIMPEPKTDVSKPCIEVPLSVQISRCGLKK